MKDNLKPSERKEWARNLYTTNGKSVKEVAFTVNVEESTLRCWIKEGAWDTVKRSLLISRQAQLEHLYDLTESLSRKIKEQDEPNHKDVDLLLKYTNAIKNVDTDNSSTYTLIDAAETFISWLRFRDHRLTLLFTAHWDRFVAERMANAA
jgi:hypothetical protein